MCCPALPLLVAVRDHRWMRPRKQLPPAAERLLVEQAGVISCAQLVEHDLSSRVIGRITKDWERVARGIYLARPAEWHSAVWAGLLRGGDHATVSGRAACYLEGALRDKPGVIQIWAPDAADGFRVGEWQITFRRGTRTGYRSPVRTRIHDSLLDVADTHDAADTIAAVTSAFSRGIADPRRLLAAAGERRRLRHRKEIQALCDPASQGVHSLIEWLFLRDVIRAHHLPEPDLQVPKGSGRVDAHYKTLTTIVELDGMRDHSNWSKDMFRDNEHLLEDGSVTFRYGLNATTRQACEAGAQLARRFIQQGWRGEPARCRKCRQANNVWSFSP